MEIETKDPVANAHTQSRYNLTAPLYNLMEVAFERFLFRVWR